MEISVIRGLWQLVDATQSHYLINLGDNELIQFLASQLVENRDFNDQQVIQIQSYIGERLHLIRDLAQSGF